MTRVTYDVVEVVDLRIRQDAPSLVDEVRAQHRAGLSTALMPVASPLARRVAPAAVPYRELVAEGAAAVLLPQGPPVSARLVIVRHPAVYAGAVEQLPTIVSDQVVVLARGPEVNADGLPLYDPDEVHRLVRERTGAEPVWYETLPGSPHLLPTGTSAAGQWTQTIDVRPWAPPSHRSLRASGAPVLGRHGELVLSWPTEGDDMAMAYPLAGPSPVLLLGQAGPVRNVLGRLPENWRVSRYDPMLVPGFLASLDIAVHQSSGGIDPRAVRPILESLASGVPTIVPPAYRELLGAAACYAEPAEVATTVRSFTEDPSRYEQRSDAAMSLTRSRFGTAQHLRRVRALLDTTPAPVQQQHLTTPPAPERSSAQGIHPGPRVLMVSSNGAGMGHLTRLLAYSRALGSRADARFLSMSQAVPVVGQWGHPYDYLPSAQATGMPSKAWQALYLERAIAVIDEFGPDVVVFDGTWPYAATARIRSARPGPRWVWSRRGMWRPDTHGRQLANSSWFDVVMEPGDLAESYDRGATATATAHRVGPVTLIDRSDVETREAARSALGLPQEIPLALISLGAGNINDTADDTGAAIAALRRLGVEVCLTQAQISTGGQPPSDVHLVRDYPLARRYRAFDIVISASGYNSFHELLRIGVPSLFVPNAATALDDQEARARYAADQGWAHQMARITVDEAVPLLADLLDRGQEMVAGAVAADPGNGSAAAADLLLRVAAGETISGVAS